MIKSETIILIGHHFIFFTVCHSDEFVHVFRCILKHTASTLASGSSWMPFSSLSHGKYVLMTTLVDTHETKKQYVLLPVYT